METLVKKQLSIIASKIRLLAVGAVYEAQSGHPGGSLSIADILAYLYFEEMNVDATKPKNDDSDKFVLSKGHTSPAYYAALALKGFFPTEEMKYFRKTGAMLQGHPDMKGTPGVDMSSGSLGQGISAACGMALAAKIDKKDIRVYTILGDGETEEGQVWEAAMFAAHKNLDNLVVIIDNNGLQIDGKLSEVCSPEPLNKKFEAFGFKVVKTNGHDFDEIENAFKIARQTKGMPTAIIAKTIKGKGVSFMENNADWHGKAPNPEQYEKAKSEIEKEIAILEG